MTLKLDVLCKSTDTFCDTLTSDTTALEAESKDIASYYKTAVQEAATLASEYNSAAAQQRDDESAMRDHLQKVRSNTFGDIKREIGSRHKKNSKTKGSSSGGGDMILSSYLGKNAKI